LFCGQEEGGHGVRWRRCCRDNDCIEGKIAARGKVIEAKYFRTLWTWTSRDGTLPDG